MKRAELRTLEERVGKDWGKPIPAVLGFTAETIPALFLERCQRTPHKVAFRVKDYGIYNEVTWGAYLEHVENLCLGLIELGLEKGDRVAIMGDPCPEWLYADLAVQSAGAISYGIYSTSSIGQVKYLMEDGGAKFFVAEDQEFADKVLSVADELTYLERIIVSDTRAMFLYNDPRLMNMAEVERIGAEYKEKDPGLFARLVSQVRPDDVSTIIYTSGTTSEPKGAMITHRNFLWSRFDVAIAQAEYFFDKKAKTIANLSMAHVLGRFQDEYYPILTGHITHFPEDEKTVAETIFEVAPTIFVGVPRTLEKYASQLVTSMQNSSWLKKLSYGWAMAVGRRYIRKRWEGRIPLALNLLYWLARQLVFRPLLGKIGFDQCKLAMVGAAPVPSEIVTLWQIWGVNVLELYGQTEAGNVAVQRERFSRPGNTGLPFARTQVKLGEQDELLIKGPGTFRRFLNKDEETAKTIDEEGWVHTGDVVSIDDEGRLRIVDRVKDIQITSGGLNITPSEIEKALKGSPYISEAIVFADGRKYPSALIEIDFDSVEEWARNNGILYTGQTSLATNAEVYKLINEEVKKANERLSRPEQVKRFRVIPKEFDPEDEADPVTSTRKMQRKKVYEKFSDLVESMYSKDEEERVRAEIAEASEGGDSFNKRIVEVGKCTKTLRKEERK